MVEILLKIAQEENTELKKKVKALDTALDLLKQKRDNAIQNWQTIKSSKNHPVDELLLNEEIKTYTDCITTIEAELGRIK